MPEPSRSGDELTTISLICPLWGQGVDVTVLCDARGLVGLMRCPLCQPGTACLAACEDQVRRWCEYAA